MWSYLVFYVIRLNALQLNERVSFSHWGWEKGNLLYLTFRNKPQIKLSKLSKRIAVTFKIYFIFSLVTLGKMLKTEKSTGENAAAKETAYNRLLISLTYK